MTLLFPILNFSLSAGLGRKWFSWGRLHCTQQILKSSGAAWGPMNISSLETSRRSRWVGMGESGSGISDALRYNIVQFLGYYCQLCLVVIRIFSCRRKHWNAVETINNKTNSLLKKWLPSTCGDLAVVSWYKFGIRDKPVDWRHLSFLASVSTPPGLHPCLPYSPNLNMGPRVEVSEKTHSASK